MKLALYKNNMEIKNQLFNMAGQIDAFDLDKHKRCFITILKGGNFTASAVIQNLKLRMHDDVIFDYLGLSSYGHGTVSSKHVETTYPLELTEEEVGDRIIWLIDDIKDSGLTLWVAREIVKKKYPKATVRTAVLINKAHGHSEHVPKFEPDVFGFNYAGNKFLVGCGLGLDEKYRGVPALYEIEKE
jgi:hypoxanthine phosphoribosyltransferase